MVVSEKFNQVEKRRGHLIPLSKVRNIVISLGTPLFIAYLSGLPAAMRTQQLLPRALPNQGRHWMRV